MATILDVHPYGVVSEVDTDVASPLGGAIDTSHTKEFLDVVGLVQLVSSDPGDIAAPNVTVVGLDSGNNALQEMQQPNGQTPVPFTTTFAQLLKASVSAAAIGDLAIEAQTPTTVGNASAGTATTITCPSAPAGLEGQIIRLTGGTDAGEIRLVIQQVGQDLTINRAWTTPPDGSTTYRVAPGFFLQSAPFSTLQARRLFYNVAADVTAKVIYDKFYFRNDSPTDTILAPIVSMVDPSGLIAFGLASAINDVVSTVDRLSTPSGITFGTTPQPSPADLAPGDRIGVWVRISIPAAYVGFVDATSIFNLAWTA